MSRLSSLLVLITDVSSQMVSRIDSRLKTDNQDVVQKMTEHRQQLDRVEIGVLDMDQRLKQEQTANENTLEGIKTTVDQSRSAIFSLRTLSAQITTFIRSFPRELRDCMRRLLQDNYNTYQIMLQIQRSVAARPTTLLDSNIKFEDALGRTRELPYEYFRHWEVCIRKLSLYIIQCTYCSSPSRVC